MEGSDEGSGDSDDLAPVRDTPNPPPSNSPLPHSSPSTVSPPSRTSSSSTSSPTAPSSNITGGRTYTTATNATAVPTAQAAFITLQLSLLGSSESPPPPQQTPPVFLPPLPPNETKDAPVAPVVEEKSEEKLLAQHLGYNCSVCLTKDIEGVRYTCQECVECHLCSQCEEDTGHDHSHNLLKIRTPSPRQTAEQSPLSHYVLGAEHVSPAAARAVSIRLGKMRYLRASNSPFSPSKFAVGPSPQPGCSMHQHGLEGRRVGLGVLM